MRVCPQLNEWISLCACAISKLFMVVRSFLRLVGLTVSERYFYDQKRGIVFVLLFVFFSFLLLLAPEGIWICQCRDGSLFETHNRWNKYLKHIERIKRCSMMNFLGSIKFKEVCCIHCSIYYVIYWGEKKFRLTRWFYERQFRCIVTLNDFFHSYISTDQRR